MWDIAPLVFIVPAGRYIGCLELKMFFKRGCFRCGGIFWYSDWHKIVILFSATLHVILKVMPHTAHGRSLLQEAAAAEDASRAAVHVECSDTLRLQKAQRQAPPDNPETGDTYRSRGRSCFQYSFSSCVTSSVASLPRPCLIIRKQLPTVYCCCLLNEL